MPRINLEDDLLAGKRFEKLMLKLGGKRAALGAVVEAWIIAQRYWKLNDHGIPRDVWDREELCPAIIEVDLAEDRGEFVYVRGSKEQFAWLRGAVESGRKGGKARAERRLELLEIIPSGPKGTLSGPKGFQPSSSSSYSKKNNTYVETASAAPTDSDDESQPEGKACAQLPLPALPEEASPPISAVPPAAALLEVWNVHCGNLPKATKLTPKRERAARARLKENPDMAYWEGIAKRMAASDFCNNRASSSNGWKASFDFFITADAHVKALEGRYDNAGGFHAATPLPMRKKSPEELMEQAKAIARGEWMRK